MASQYPDNQYRDNAYNRPRSQSGARPSGTRVSSSRPGGTRVSTSRPGGTRVSSGRSGGTRVSQSYSGARRASQPPRRKKPNSRFFVFLALLVAVILLAVFVLPRVLGCGKDEKGAGGASQTQTQTEPQTQENTGWDFVDPNGGAVTAEPADQSLSGLSNEDLAERLQSEDVQIGGLAAEDMVKVENLSINQNLPGDWVNILLMGTDERTLNESARTDSLMICSLNPTTGEVKLTSILRDLAVTFDDIGRYNGTYRINAANFFGGPELAMKTVNECFGMNISRYAIVNFYGFQRVVEAIGGIEIDITEAEMNEINTWAYDSYTDAKYYGVDVSDVVYEVLDTYGTNVHLNGTQTLAYSRIRKLDGGGDITRAERQRKVLEKLLEKVKTLDTVTVLMMVDELIGNVSTNMSVSELAEYVYPVMTGGLGEFKTLRLPVNGSYVSERRDNKDMMWDCDFERNARELYNFIYVN